MWRERLKVPLLIVAIPLAAIAVHIVVLRPLIGLAITGSKDYVYRAYVWGDSDIYDYEKFPSRPIQNETPTFHFKPASAAEAFVPPDGFEELLEASGTTAFLIVRDDTLLYEGYFNGFQRDSWFTSFSVAKSFDSALIGLAISEGLIGSVDDPVVSYLPELKGRGLDDLTIRNLLKMDCGVRYEQSDLTDFLAMQSDDSLTYYLPDLRALALTIRPSREPIGSCFRYNNFHPILEGMILERVTGMTVSEYLQERLWKPLGMEYPATWSINQEGDGLEKMESGLNARAIDFAKFGRLYLNRGQWEGRQILPEAWVIESTAPEPGDARPQTGADRYSETDGYYQFHWWGTKRENGLYDFAAAGHLGQYISVRPDQNLILVRFGTETNTEVNWFLEFQELGQLLSQ
jgi:CubicO group peptidase (beta-lactamase class C family)